MSFWLNCAKGDAISAMDSAIQLLNEPHSISAMNNELNAIISNCKSVIYRIEEHMENTKEGIK